MTTYGYIVYTNSDMTEGRGPMVPGNVVYLDEQEAWDTINEKGGVMGRHPRDFDFGDWADASTWQEYEANGGYGEYKVRSIEIR